MISLTGQLLIAMPQMLDPRFARSVVYVCAHSENEGAMGLVVNKLFEALTMDELFTHLKLDPGPLGRSRPVCFGGPVEPGRGFVLHTADYREEATLVVTDGLAVTATLDILRAIGTGRRAAAQPAGARLCRLGAGPARRRDAGQWLAVGAGRRGSGVRPRFRGQMAARARQTRHRPDAAYPPKPATPDPAAAIRVRFALQALPPDWLVSGRTRWHRGRSSTSA